MASRYYKQFLFSSNPGLTLIEGSFRIGVAGAVMANSFVGDGLWASSTVAVRRGGGAGVYQLNFEDPFARVLGMEFDIIPGPSSAGVVDGSGNIILGKPYQIVAVNGSSAGILGGGTDWYTLGLPTNQRPAPGVIFTPTSGASLASAAMGTGTGIGSGSGVLQLIGVSGLSHVELLPGYNAMIGGLPASSAVYGSGGTNSGGSVWFQTRLSSSGAPVNATCGTTIRFTALLRNSSLLNVNEVAGTDMVQPNN